MTTEHAFAIVAWKLLQWGLHALWFVIPPILLFAAGMQTEEGSANSHEIAKLFTFLAAITYSTIIVGYVLGWNVVH